MTNISGHMLTGFFSLIPTLQAIVTKFYPNSCESADVDGIFVKFMLQ